MRRAVFTLVIVLLVVATASVTFLLFGVGQGGGSEEQAEPSRVPERTPVADPPPRSVTLPPDPALAPYYSQVLAWDSCRDDFECARLEVPLDYADPDGETIEIQLLRAPARVPEQRVGSLVVNPGGPGSPGTELAVNARLIFRAPLRDNFDIVGFDPRGTGESAPVDCLSDDDLDDYYAGAAVPETAAERREHLAADRRFIAGCAELSGRLAGHVSTIEAARDMDVLRAALGEDTMSYFGASYGTQLGATYADLFPERAGHLVLDAGVHPTADPLEMAIEQAAGFEVALRAYVENCTQSSGCFLGDSVDEGVTAIQELLGEIGEQPMPTSLDGRELSERQAFYGVIAPLYDRRTWSVLSTALRMARSGDGTLLLTLADFYASRGADGYEDNSTEAIRAIRCLDDPDGEDVTVAEVVEALPDFEAASPTFGREAAWLMTSCAGTRLRSAEEPRDLTAAGAPPILVIGTTRDPATPIHWAEALADHLESGVLIRRDGDGHTGYNQGSSCVNDAVESFLLDGTVPDGPLDCAPD